MAVELQLLTRPASDLAVLVRAGELSSRELVEAALARIEEVNPKINAFTLVDADGALAAADEIHTGDPRPFAGVPIAIKDLGVAVKGLRMANGSELMGDFTPDYDSYVVRRIRDAGFVIVGKTQTPELGITPVTNPRRFGPALNPWDLERTPGGSSGGSAAAVAAGCVPIAHASDGGGSIRIPAACTGLVGLKPSRGRISRGPETGDNLLSTDGVVSRTVADTATALDVLQGYEPGDATWAPPPSMPYEQAMLREPGVVHIGLVTKPALGKDPDPAAVQAARDAGAMLESMGHVVEEVDPPWDAEETLDVFLDFWSTSVGVGVRYAANVSGREPTPELVEPLTWALNERALGLTSVDHMFRTYALHQLGRRIVGWMQQYDMLLTPALGQRPVRIEEIDPCNEHDPMGEFMKAADFTPFTAAFNVTGTPAISVPMYEGEDGLPLAVQLAGRQLAEDDLLTLAYQLEQRQLWQYRLAQV